MTSLGDAPMLASRVVSRMFVKSIAATGARASWASVGAMASGARLATPRGRGAAVRAGGLGRGLQGLEPLGELLALLQDQLQLVLGPRDLPCEPGDVGSSGDAQVAHHEVDRAGRDRTTRSIAPVA